VITCRGREIDIERERQRERRREGVIDSERERERGRESEKERTGEIERLLRRDGPARIQTPISYCACVSSKVARGIKSTSVSL